MTEEIKQPTQLEQVKAELKLLKDLRELLKAYTRVGPSDAQKLAQIWQWTGTMIQISENFVAEENKKAKADAK